MKKYRIICVLSAVAALLSVSCSKENTSIEPQNPEGANTIQISISGEFSDFATTKGSVESIFRMKWSTDEKKDIVYVYGTTGSKGAISTLGTLTATVVDGSDARVADLSGTITAPTDGTKLTLVYSPLFTSVPSLRDGAITQSLASQEGGASDVTFIAYATVDYGGETASTYRTSFKFATSVLRVNASGLGFHIAEADKTQALTSATISGISTACKLTISTSAEPTVEGVYAKDSKDEDITSIVKTFTSVNTNAKGNIAFYVALPVTAANTDRSLSIVETSSSHTYLYPKFATGEVSTGGNMLNTIAAIPTPVKYTENSVDLGYGTFIPETGAIWAPVNCGYDATHTYGLLYQWGRKYGQGYDEETPAVVLQNSQLSTVAAGSDVSNKENFYWGNSVWTSASTSGTDDWFTTYNPCPAGWRVPTYAELNALLGSHTSGSLQTGTHGSTSSLSGKWFDGSTTSNPTSGVFLPAAGCRGFKYGSASARGDFGIYWSSSVDGDDAKYLHFFSGTALMGSGGRAVGYSVRCVQE